MTTIARTPAELIAVCDEARRKGSRVGLVPTMGNLHAGHMSLVAAAREHADFVVLTLFVNPLQFGPSEDFTRYPRTFEADMERCKAASVDVVFAPDAASMFPADFKTHVEVASLSEVLEGSFRPGHFRGVATICTKLFQLAAPCDAVFGRKDYQQFLVLCRLVEDLNLRVRMWGAPIVRDADGLALSSRNQYLTPAERARALAIHGGLESARRAFAEGERDATRLRALAAAPIEKAFDVVDYVAVCNAQTLESLKSIDSAAVILVAARIGTTRLIDNVTLG